MNILQRWYSRLVGEKVVPPIKFGRYDEVQKSPERFKAWDEALAAFNKGSFVHSVNLLLAYLYDPVEDNIQWKQSEHKVEFTIHHGSQELEGWANANEFHAEVRLGNYDSDKPELFERLLQMNYNLNYSKFCLRGNTIISKFSSKSLDASPFKLYAGLRELALQTDKQDDLALANQEEFQPLFSRKVKMLEPAVLNTKIQYYQNQWEELEMAYDHCGLDPEDYPGAYAYLLMNFCYKVDFLLSPEALLMELLEDMHQDYFHGAQQISYGKNKEVFQKIAAFNDRSLEQWRGEFYEVCSTFGITSPVSKGQLKQFIQQEVDKMDWYINNGHREIALAIPGYIVGYSLFHYALPGPFRAFFSLYYEVMEADYFKNLGFRPVLSQAGTPHKMEIEQQLKSLLDQSKKRFPGINLELNNIRYDSAFHFSKSYLLNLCQMEW